MVAAIGCGGGGGGYLLVVYKDFLVKLSINDHIIGLVHKKTYSGVLRSTYDKMKYQV